MLSHHVVAVVEQDIRGRERQGLDGQREDKYPQCPALHQPNSSGRAQGMTCLKQQKVTRIQMKCTLWKHTAETDQQTDRQIDRQNQIPGTLPEKV